VWDGVNGAANILLAIVVWALRDSIGPLGFGVLLGVRMAASGWQTLFAPAPVRANEFARPEEQHPDLALGLAPHPIVGVIHREALADAPSRTRRDVHWSLILVAVFFAIHVGRVDADWTWLGMLTPAVATLGDVFTSFLLALAVLLPLEILWRRLTRPIERSVWHRMLDDTSPDHHLRWSERALRWWAEHRLRRYVAMDLENNTLEGAIRQTIRTGLPLTAVLVAVNPIWGFSWYFNSENWASAAWQRIAETRVDGWRAAMIDGVVRAAGAPDATAGGLFEVRPPRMEPGQDFSFIVLGDPGEGDPSQHALRDQLLVAARREAVKFVVIASDVVYPDGAMKDYETNFYLPLKGIDKPVYAIPGNHDWFNALDGFAANLLEPVAARAAMEARVQSDLSLSSTTPGRIDQLIAQAARLRSLYRLPVAQQRAPFFEFHAGDFSLVAIDTGILKSVDERQMAWLRAALDRANGAFTMAILGHPYYAAGLAQPGEASFAEVRELLRARGVPIVMAGDTHDFEYYREDRGSTPTHHFVNGGGGAYLSIGTALDWPAEPAFADYAFYPRTDAVTMKLEAETPPWKWPAWWWAKRFGAWPFSIEALSAVFDFNRAPHFQSFVEVRVERSRSRVVVAVMGVDGALRWRDVQVGGAIVPDGQTPDDPAEFVVPLP
jgi:3',5'-cyclic AMP phosphodiesterase CpdA